MGRGVDDVPGIGIQAQRRRRMGTMAAQLPYMGTPRIVAIGTEKIPVLLMIPCIVS